jgi:hypothetical protein
MIARIEKDCCKNESLDVNLDNKQFGKGQKNAAHTKIG